MSLKLDYEVRNGFLEVSFQQLGISKINHMYPCVCVYVCDLYYMGTNDTERSR